MQTAQSPQVHKWFLFPETIAEIKAAGQEARALIAQLRAERILPPPLPPSVMDRRRSDRRFHTMGDKLAHEDRRHSDRRFSNVSFFEAEWQ